jgi:hypothetical protein
MCPLDEEEPPRRPTRPRQQSTKPSPERVPTMMEGETECNYVILFFIVGVIVLALMDSM